MKNRKVKVFGAIDAGEDEQGRPLIDYEVVIEEAIFLEFGTRKGTSTAIIEHKNGGVEMFHVEDIQFIKEEPKYEVFDYTVDNICKYKNPHSIKQLDIFIGYAICNSCKHHRRNDKLNKKVTCSYKHDNK